jgi:hypothetical protein
VDVRDLLLPGDLLLYRPNGLFGRIIAIKTSHDLSHCEVYLGKGVSAAARDGVGVGRYPTRLAQLAYILRPTATELDWIAYARWFKTVDGQKYDWTGLLRFAWFKSIGTGNNNRMFCSEFCARAYRALGMEPFTELVDADAVAPAAFIFSSKFTIIATPQSLASLETPK